MFLIALGMSLVPRYALAVAPTKLECIAANDSAQDLRREGKLREAREKLVLCGSQSCPGPVRQDCAERLAEVDAAMPSVVIEVADAHGNALTDVGVQMDGRPFVDHIDSSSWPVDPGSHRFTFDAADGAHAEQTIMMAETEKGRPLRVVLGAGAVAPEALRARSEWTMEKTIGVAVGGAGVVGLVVGSIFGAVALGNASGLKSQAGCPSNCPSSAQSQIDTLHGNQWGSDIGLGVGVVGLGLGAALFFTARPPEAVPATSLRFDVGPGAVGFRGRF